MNFHANIIDYRLDKFRKLLEFDKIGIDEIK